MRKVFFLIFFVLFYSGCKKAHKSTHPSSSSPEQFAEKAEVKLTEQESTGHKDQKIEKSGSKKIQKKSLENTDEGELISSHQKNSTEDPVEKVADEIKVSKDRYYLRQKEFSFIKSNEVSHPLRPAQLSGMIIKKTFDKKTSTELECSLNTKLDIVFKKNGELFEYQLNESHSSQKLDLEPLKQLAEIKNIKLIFNNKKCEDHKLNKINFQNMTEQEFFNLEFHPFVSNLYKHFELNLNGKKMKGVYNEYQFQVGETNKVEGITVKTYHHYKTYQWHTVKKKSVNRQRFSTTLANLADEFFDPNDKDCNICEESQKLLMASSIDFATEDIKVCNKYYPYIIQALREIRKSNKFEITDLKAYRPGRTRGRVDRENRSTKLSNHSYGAAIDINKSSNGLYKNCRSPINRYLDEIKHCTLGVGGKWGPKDAPDKTIIKNGIVHLAFSKFWLWGGEIEKSYKNMMHFSLTGE